MLVEKLPESDPFKRGVLSDDADVLVEKLPESDPFKRGVLSDDIVRVANGVPQEIQKLALSAFGFPHFGQFMVSLL